MKKIGHILSKIVVSFLLFTVFFLLIDSTFTVVLGEPLILYETSYYWLFDIFYIPLSLVFVFFFNKYFCKLSKSTGSKFSILVKRIVNIIIRIIISLLLCFFISIFIKELIFNKKMGGCSIGGDNRQLVIYDFCIGHYIFGKEVSEEVYNQQLIKFIPVPLVISLAFIYIFNKYFCISSKKVGNKSKLIKSKKK